MEQVKYQIQIKRIDKYGKKHIYPCNYQAQLAVLTGGKKTLDEGDLAALEQMGFTIYDCDKEIEKLAQANNIPTNVPK